MYRLHLKLFRKDTFFFRDFNLKFYLDFSVGLYRPRLAYNVVAAWRQAGASVRLGREQKMLLLALCQTSLHPRLRETAR